MVARGHGFRGPVEGSKAHGSAREVKLTPGQPRDPQYVFRRLFEAQESCRIHVACPDKTVREVADQFQKFVDIVHNSLWARAALLKVDVDTRSVVFSNGCVVSWDGQLTR